ncbi:DUF2577 family protein [Psychrobacillus sp. FSL K6-2684]|uniref:DUF2577 family protein n=1 Tax=Psychrobacillus sp. FSL K6-2684 TaxID=2921547 RepID=UPI0030F4BAB7
MAEDAITGWGKLFRERDHKPSPSMTTGIVISPPPEAQIRLNEVIVLEKHQLVFASHMLIDYKRELEMTGEIKFDDSNAGTSGSTDGHTHTIETLNVDTNYEAKNVEITTKDTIRVGDEVILQPAMDEQLYYVLDKAVRFT